MVLPSVARLTEYVARRVLAYALLTGNSTSLAGAQTPILYGFDGNAAFVVRGSVAAHPE